MSTTSKRLTEINFSGDVSGDETIVAADNTISPAKIDFITLANGANTITPPTNATAVTIVPPAANVISIVIRGTGGDTTLYGIRIHNTDPTTIAIDSSVASFLLVAGAQIIGVRLFWS